MWTVEYATKTVVWTRIDRCVFSLTKTHTFENALVWTGPQPAIQRKCCFKNRLVETWFPMCCISFKSAQWLPQIVDLYLCYSLCFGESFMRPYYHRQSRRHFMSSGLSMILHCNCDHSDHQPCTDAGFGECNTRNTPREIL